MGSTTIDQDIQSPYPPREGSTGFTFKDNFMSFQENINQSTKVNQDLEELESDTTSVISGTI